MSKYSFLLQAEEIEYFDLLPTLRLQKHGDWLVAESIEQEEINRTQSQATIRAVQLAKKIAAARDIALDEAFEMLQGAGGLTEMDLLGEFTDETLSMLNSTSGVEASNARIVTTFIRCRGEALLDGQWQRVEDWSLEDTKNMGKKLIAKTLTFISEEQEQESGDADQAKKSKTSQANPTPKS
jgi:hypothetical protein